MTAHRPPRTKPTVVKDDPVHGLTEVHPAFGHVRLNRVSAGPSGISLFDSDVRHHHFVELTVSTGRRTRMISHDFHIDDEEVVQLWMSQAQWASLVSSFNTSGVPCTIHRREGDYVDELDDEPRLGKTMAESRTAASRAFDELLPLVAELDRLIDEKAGIREVREVLRDLKIRIENAPKNVDYATKTLARHAEDVVQKVRADIEAMVVQHAAQLGIETPAFIPLQLTTGDDQ